MSSFVLTNYFKKYNSNYILKELKMREQGFFEKWLVTIILSILTFIIFTWLAFFLYTTDALSRNEKNQQNVFNLLVGDSASFEKFEGKRRYGDLLSNTVFETRVLTEMYGITIEKDVYYGRYNSVSENFKIIFHIPKTISKNKDFVKQYQQILLSIISLMDKDKISQVNINDLYDYNNQIIMLVDKYNTEGINYKKVGTIGDNALKVFTCVSCLP